MVWTCAPLWGWNTWTESLVVQRIVGQGIGAGGSAAPIRWVARVARPAFGLGVGGGVQKKKPKVRDLRISAMLFQWRSSHSFSLPWTESQCGCWRQSRVRNALISCVSSCSTTSQKSPRFCLNLFLSFPRLQVSSPWKKCCNTRWQLFLLWASSEGNRGGERRQPVNLFVLFQCLTGIQLARDSRTIPVGVHVFFGTGSSGGGQTRAGQSKELG